MPKTKFLSKDKLREAMKYTQSNMAAARYCGCSYQHYKKFSKMYIDEETGKTFHELHANPSGKGIPKFMGGKLDNTPLLDILEGRVTDLSGFTVGMLKSRLIKEAFLREECYNCGLNERREVDYKVPLVLYFKDGNKENWVLNNLEFRCYNCYFLYIGNVFSDKEIKSMENYEVYKDQNINDNWDISEEDIKQLKELNLWEDDSEDMSGEEFISKL